MGLSLHIHKYFVYASSKGFYEYVISTKILRAFLYMVLLQSVILYDKHIFV